MGKINKFANLYDKDCTSENCSEHLLKHVDESGVLRDYTLEELEQLVDKLGNDKDENGRIRNKQAFDNASYMLFKYYQLHGNPHEQEIKDLLAKTKPAERPIEEQKNDALKEVMDEYVDYEEVKES